MAATNRAIPHGMSIPEAVQLVIQARPLLLQKIGVIPRKIGVIPRKIGVIPNDARDLLFRCTQKSRFLAKLIPGGGTLNDMTGCALNFGN